jgi:hypothetical protein
MLYSTWLLVVEPRHMPLEWSSTCGSLMDDASVYNMNDRSYMRNGGGKED